MKDREKYKAKRKTVVETEAGTKRCNTCFQVFPVEEFQGTRGETMTCSVCRESNKRADAKRDKEHVQEIARKNAQKPERKAVKQEWKEKNPEKCAQYWIDARARDIEKDSDAYLQKQAEQSKKWRDANPEKVKENNQERNNNIHVRYSNYVTTSKPRGLEFTISEDEFIEMVKTPCYYCGIIQEKGFNGIDRLDSNLSYHKHNCVSCCEMCNMMKSSSGPNVFVHRTEHILTYLGIVQGNLYPSEFSEAKGLNYNSYKSRATKKDIPFEVTEEMFYKTREKCCYLCGKQEGDTHKNGIDRFDNAKGYTEENIRSCCCNCNYMKKNYKYDSLIDKLNLIYEFQKRHPIEDCLNKEIRTIVPGKKLSKEEKNESQAIRKKEKMRVLLTKYTDEEAKKVWISEIVKNRKR
jgi:hypothetical protein